MPDPDNEVRFLGYQWSLEECYNPFERTPLQGHSDAEIATIDGYLLPDLSQNPNIVFLFAGTNDINNNDDIDNAPARLMAVVDNITTTLPKTTVLVGTIPLNGDATKEQRSDTFNDNIVQMLLRRA
jgi:lysophospholipase L1-like esterase